MKSDTCSTTFWRYVFCFLLLGIFSFQPTAYPAASDYYDTVQKIYIGYYQRPADPAGLIWWAEELDRGGGNLVVIIEAFANSDESKALYGTIDSSNIATVVNGIYVTMFNRDAEEAGRDWYVAEFNKGTFTAATIMLNVLYGAGGTDLQSINNKLAASNIFTRIIDPEFDGSSFQVTYAGDSDAIAGRNFLSLYATATKIPTQDETTAYIRYNIANPGDAILRNDGIPLWAKTVAGATDETLFNVVAAGIDGSVYGAGYIKGATEVDFGNSVKAKGTYSGGYNPVVVKYNRDGIAQWAKTVTTGNRDSFFGSVAVGSDGSVYASGMMHGTGVFGFGNSVTAQGTYPDGPNAILVKYSIDGTAQWAKTVTTGNNNSDFGSVAVGPDGYVYAAGYIKGTGIFGFGNSVTAQGTCSSGENIILVKYSAAGTPQWAKSVTSGTIATDFYRIAAGSDAVYAVGFIKGPGTSIFSDSGATTEVKAQGLTANPNVLIVKYGADGTAKWANTVTAGSDPSYFYYAAVGSDGYLYTTGYIYGTGQFGFGNSVTAQGQSSGYNALLVKYDKNDGKAQWAKTTTGASYSGHVSIAAGSDGAIYTAGALYGAGTIGFGNSVTAAGSYGLGANLLLVKYDSDGKAQWARSVISGNKGSFFNGVAIGAGGYLYASGYITGTEAYGLGNSITATGSCSLYNILMAKYK